jgi:hypothetical protein
MEYTADFECGLCITSYKKLQPQITACKLRKGGLNPFQIFVVHFIAHAPLGDTLRQKGDWLN